MTFTTKDITKPNQFNKDWFSIQVTDQVEIDLSLSADRKSFLITSRVGLQVLSDGEYVTDLWKKVYTLAEAKQVLVDYANHYAQHGYFCDFPYLYN